MPIVRAVYYARVSTEEEAQINALDKQIIELEEVICKKQWVIVERYVDQGKSGTSRKSRNEYNRLYEDMLLDTFDVIVIKSQDRLMRNTKDWYLFIDRLITNNKKLYMYMENNFYTTDDALITGIKAILAEEYSKDLSKKINNAHRRRQAEGKSILLTNSTWGYKKVKKEVVIDEKEAEIIRLIFLLYSDGNGGRVISKILEKRGIKARSGGIWQEASVRRIIKNELYKGNVIMNRSHYDFNTKKTIKNPPDQWIRHINAVPAIVSEELWERANNVLSNNRNPDRCLDRGKKIEEYHNGKFNLSSKIICGECGATYWRRKILDRKLDVLINYWCCSTYVSRGRKTGRRKKETILDEQKIGCDNVRLLENDVLEILHSAINSLDEEKDDIINEIISLLNESIETSFGAKDISSLLKEQDTILNQKDVLLNKLVNGIITDADYKRFDNSLNLQSENVKTKMQEIENQKGRYLDNISRLDRIKTVLYSSSYSETSVQLAITHLNKMVVFQNHIDIYFDYFDFIKIVYKHKKNTNGKYTWLFKEWKTDT